MTTEQLNFLFTRYPEGHQYFIPLYLGTLGLSLKEVFALSIEDVLVDRIVIHRGVNYQHKLYFYELPERIVPLTKSESKVLQRHINRIMELRLILKYPQYEFNPITVDIRTGKYVNPRAIFNISKSYSWFKFRDIFSGHNRKR